MEELHVKPHLWFETVLDGRLYKCKIKRYGLGYATIRIEERSGIKKRKKYHFFGPMIDEPFFDILTKSHRDDDLDPIMNYRTSYKATYIKKIIKQIVDQKPSIKHSYNI